MGTFVDPERHERRKRRGRRLRQTRTSVIEHTRTVQSPTRVRVLRAASATIRTSARPHIGYERDIEVRHCGSLLLSGAGIGSVECAPALVAVKVVRPLGRCTLTAPARRRPGWGAGPGRGFSAVVVAGSVVGAGPGSG